MAIETLEPRLLLSSSKPRQL
ncbi:LEPR-XLL domain-containing protein [Vibrio thalassae]